MASAINEAEPGLVPVITRTVDAPRLWRRHNVRVWTARMLVAAAIIGGWQLAAGTIVNVNQISRPSDVASQLVTWSNSGYLYTQTWTTLEETLEGFVIGSVAGIALGIGFGMARATGETVEPFFIAAYGMPKVALAPLFIVWFGIGITMKVVLAALSVFFLVFWNTYTGVRQTDPGVLDVVHLLRASRRQVVLKVVLPGALPWIYGGLRLGLPYGFVGAIVGEIIASNQGLGYLVSYSASIFDTTALMAALVALVVLTTILSLVVTAFENRGLRWQRSDGKGGQRAAGKAKRTGGGI